MTCCFSVSVQCTGLKAAGSGSRSLLIYINLLRVSNVTLQVRVFRETGPSPAQPSPAQPSEWCGCGGRNLFSSYHHSSSGDCTNIAQLQMCRHHCTPVSQRHSSTDIPSCSEQQPTWSLIPLYRTLLVTLVTQSLIIVFLQLNHTILTEINGKS